MYKLFIAAALAASTYAVDENCCELYVEENYGGHKETACLPKNFQDAYLDSYAYSFLHIGGVEPMNDALGSYECGSMVKADFCLSEPHKYRDDNNLTQYECVSKAFGNDFASARDPGPLRYMNLVSSIVVYQGGAPP